MDMEMKGLVIGLGAAGNKATINLVENKVIDKEDLMLINSTSMDVPADYKDACYLLKGTDGGFGKERAKSRESMLNFLKEGNFPIKAKVEKSEYKFVVLVTSTEGGTGSGAATVLASYVSKVIKLPTHIVGFTGFGSDGRGLQNTVEFLKDMEKTFTVHMIRNERFLQECGNSKIRAEKAANEELATIIRIIEGQLIKESTQNIDPRDIYKTVNTPGYQIDAYRELNEKIRNSKDFDRILTEMLDESHLMETSPSQLRLAVILNMNETSQTYCDDYHVLKERLGSCYEEYTHRQSEPGKEYIAFISSGLKMPLKEAEEIYEKYQEAAASVDTDDDEFFSEVSKLKGNESSSLFDMSNNDINSGSDEDFFAQFESGEQEKEKQLDQQKLEDQY